MAWSVTSDHRPINFTADAPGGVQCSVVHVLRFIRWFDVSVHRSIGVENGFACAIDKEGKGGSIGPSVVVCAMGEDDVATTRRQRRP